MENEMDIQISQEDVSNQFGRMIFSNMQLSKQVEALQKQIQQLKAKLEKAGLQDERKDE